MNAVTCAPSVVPGTTDERSILIKRIQSQLDLMPTWLLNEIDSIISGLKPTDYDVRLHNAGRLRILTMKQIRDITSTTLDETKRIVDNLPCTIVHGTWRENAEAIRDALLNCGSEGVEVELVPLIRNMERPPFWEWHHAGGPCAGWSYSVIGGVIGS